MGTNKFILSLAGLSLLTISSLGQGLIYFDGTYNSATSINATNEGRIFLNGQLDTRTDINAELVYGTTPAAVSLNNPVVTLLLSSTNIAVNSTLGQTSTAAGDITLFANGDLYDPSGVGYQFPTIAPGTTVYFQVYGWTGNYNSFTAAEAAEASGNWMSANSITAESGVFSEVLASPYAPDDNDIENMNALVFALVPEPTTMVLASLGVLSLSCLRRKK
jgi:hypothetical protein